MTPPCTHARSWTLLPACWRPPRATQVLCNVYRLICTAYHVCTALYILPAVYVPPHMYCLPYVYRLTSSHTVPVLYVLPHMYCLSCMYCLHAYMYCLYFWTDANVPCRMGLPPAGLYCMYCPASRRCHLELTCPPPPCVSDARSLMAMCHQMTEHPGSATCILAVMKPGGMLDVANLGDSGEGGEGQGGCSP